VALHQLCPDGSLANHPVDHQATSSDSPNFLAVTDTSYWAVLTQEQDNYLNGALAVSFDASTSSSVAGGALRSPRSVLSIPVLFPLSNPQMCHRMEW
jgi:hypothetical protein